MQSKMSATQLRPNEENVKQFISEMEEAFKIYKDPRTNTKLSGSKGRDIVAFIGSTGAGKSTTANIILGVPLKATSRGYEFSEEAENVNEKCKIGATGSESLTLFPQCIEHPKFLIYDLPGLNDTRGNGNAFLMGTFIQDIVTSAKSNIFLFVENIASLVVSRGANMKETINILMNLLPDKKVLKGSCGLVLTGTDDNDPDVIVAKLRDKLDSDLIAQLEEIVDLKNPQFVFPILGSAYFKEKKKGFNSKKTATEDYSTEEKYDQDEAQELLAYVKSNFEEKLGSLKGKRISEINASILLKPGTSLLIGEAMKQQAQKCLKEVLHKMNVNLISDIKVLEKLKKEYKETAFKGFRAVLDDSVETKFYKIFDEKMFEEYVKETEKDVQIQLKSYQMEIQERIHSVSKEKLEKEVKFKDAMRDYPGKCQGIFDSKYNFHSMSTEDLRQFSGNLRINLEAIFRDNLAKTIGTEGEQIKTLNPTLFNEEFNNGLRRMGEIASSYTDKVSSALDRKKNQELMTSLMEGLKNDSSVENIQEAQKNLETIKNDISKQNKEKIALEKRVVQIRNRTLPELVEAVRVEENKTKPGWLWGTNKCGEPWRARQQFDDELPSLENDIKNRENEISELKMSAKELEAEIRTIKQMAQSQKTQNMMMQMMMMAKNN